MERHVGLRRTARLQRGMARLSVVGRDGAEVIPLRPRQQRPLRLVSPKRQQENRERRAMADRRWPDRREGTVMCSVPGCPRRADDLHEILPRGRGGSITDEENTIPVCREHNEEAAKSPAWAYRAGVLKHDGVCCEGRAVCSRYSDGDDAA